MNENKKSLVIYVHGKGGNANEIENYHKFFSGYEFYGFDYKADNPWDAKKEFKAKIEELANCYENITLIANSIGAYFSMVANCDEYISHAYFVSPIVDMEKLILNMIAWAGTTETELQEKKIIPVDFGDDLSWEYLQYARSNPVKWNVSTDILYGSLDNLQELDTITTFANRINATLTVMEGGEHWFHTDEQIHFLNDWMQSRRG